MKTTHMLATGVIVAAAGCVLCAIPANAAEKLEQVTVEAARMVTVGRTAYGGPEQTVQISRKVKYGDLDLKSEAGKSELDKRLTETAKELCGELDKMYPLQDPKAHDCVHQAVDAAKAALGKAAK